MDLFHADFVASASQPPQSLPQLPSRLYVTHLSAMRVVRHLYPRNKSQVTMTRQAKMFNRSLAAVANKIPQLLMNEDFNWSWS